MCKKATNNANTDMSEDRQDKENGVHKIELSLPRHVSFDFVDRQYKKIKMFNHKLFYCVKSDANNGIFDYFPLQKCIKS